MDRRKFIQAVSLGGAAGVAPFGLSAGSPASEKLPPPVQFHPLEGAEKEIYILSNFHPASAGWLANFSLERNYCANSYLDHLDRVDHDSEYRFVLSEVNNMIAIKNFRPDRFKDLKKRIREGRVEAVNASFLECTINLSGGEALVKQGVEGIRWQQEVLDVRPRFLWMIDITGMHEQMAQITAGLGLDAYFYCRNNPTQSTMQWLVSPDGSYILGISSGHYSDWRPLFNIEVLLSDQELDSMQEEVSSRIRFVGDDYRELTPNKAPFLVLGGSGDYSLAPAYEEYPSEFIQQWNTHYPDQSLSFSTPSKYVDRSWPLFKSRDVLLPIVKGGWPFSSYKAFWIQTPKVKQRFRVSEHALQATEALATIKSIEGNEEYPTQAFYHGWLQLLLNMDRNTLWGAAGGMVFESEVSWDAKDRFDWIDEKMEAIQQTFGSSQSDAITFFNSCNWIRREPVTIQLPEGRSLEGIDCQRLKDGRVLCIPGTPSVGEATYKIKNSSPQSKEIPLPDPIETTHYRAQLDPETGDLVSVKLKPSGKELIGGRANRVVGEKPINESANLFGDHMVDRDGRQEVPPEQDQRPEIKVTTGPVATIVKVNTRFLQNELLERTVIFYHDLRRIDFATSLHNVPDKTVVVAEFPFATPAHTIRRGIPYGYAEGSWPNYDPALPGTVAGITPAVRWSEYALENDTRAALLDRGLTGREYDGRSGLIFLMAASDTYRGYENKWLSGAGEHHFEYALLAHDEGKDHSITSKAAYSYNAPVLDYQGAPNPQKTSFLKTSSNVMVQAIRREGDFIEVRMVEVTGKKSMVSVSLNLPHKTPYITNLTGDEEQLMQEENGSYHIQANPQQIITLRFLTQEKVPEIKTLTDWTPLVPAGKKAKLNEYQPDVKGHPPRGPES